MQMTKRWKNPSIRNQDHEVDAAPDCKEETIKIYQSSARWQAASGCHIENRHRREQFTETVTESSQNTPNPMNRNWILNCNHSVGAATTQVNTGDIPCNSHFQIIE